MWESLFRNMMRRMLRHGQLTVTMPDGQSETYGPGGGPEAHIILTEPDTVRRLLMRPGLALGECYAEGTLRVEGDDLPGLLGLFVPSGNIAELPPWYELPRKLQGALRGFLQRNTPFTARRNVAHHYDLSDDLYRIFLDADMQYSCAYWSRAGMTLEEAQEAKKAHIADKLLIKPGMRVLDIGCGWGGMALTLAREHGVHVTGVTLSRSQLETAQARARAEGLSEMTDFRLMDYRELTERFDRIVSVGMLEHVGLPQFPTYFAKVSDLLTRDGLALIHTIGRTAPPRPTSPWLERHIFPGGYVPSLSDLARPMESANLWLADLEVLRGHYGPTLHHWRDRFEANVKTVRAMHDDRFVRLWRFYLVACEMAFEEQQQAVFQLQLSKQQHTVPRTRDYLYSQPAQATSQVADRSLQSA